MKNKTIASCLTLGHRCVLSFSGRPCSNLWERNREFCWRCRSCCTHSAILTDTNTTEVRQDHFIRRRESEPSTELQEKGAWRLLYPWGVGGHGVRVSNFRYVQENVGKRNCQPRGCIAEFYDSLANCTTQIAEASSPDTQPCWNQWLRQEEE